MSSSVTVIGGMVRTRRSITSNGNTGPAPTTAQATNKNDEAANAPDELMDGRGFERRVTTTTGALEPDAGADPEPNNDKGHRGRGRGRGRSH